MSEAILVVDDDAPIRRMLERTLTAEGYQVVTAADGGAALATIERSVPDLVVLDVAMPGMDGLAVCRRARARGLATPILLLTARDSLSDRVGGLDAGADDYLVKPFDIPAFFAVIDGHLAAGDGPATEGSAPEVRPGDDGDGADGFEPSVLALLRRIHDRDGATDLIDAYERESRHQLCQLIEANAQCDSSSARRMAHSLKGATGTIGAVHLTTILAELESAIETGRDDVGVIVTAVADELIERFRRCAACLERPERTGNHASAYFAYSLSAPRRVTQMHSHTRYAEPDLTFIELGAAADGQISCGSSRR